MNIELNIVNTYAWMKATSNSRQFINTMSAKLNTVIGAPIPIPT